MNRRGNLQQSRPAPKHLVVTKPAARRQPLRIALEPRLLFDGAAIATAVAQLFPTAHTATHDAALHGHTEGPDLHGHGADHADLHQALATLPPAGAEASPLHADPHAVVFIDASLSDRADLLSAVPPGAQVVLLDPARDGLQQIDAALAGRTDVDAIHLITHGTVGELQLGSTTLTAQDIAADKGGLLADIGKHLAPGADVLVYGCDFGAGAQGAAATLALSHALHADVASSEDATGATSLGGDWTLERHVGAIHSQTIDAANWDGLLLGINLPPVAGIGLTAVINAGGTATVNVLATDTDPNGDAIHVTGASALHGSVTINANGALLYTPTAGYFGLDTITYTIADSHNAAALLPGLVAVTVATLPTLSIPTLPVFTEDTPIVFASVLGTQISVGNLDGTFGSLSLSVPMGHFTLAQTTGLTFSQGNGTNASAITVSGSLSAVNAALNGLVYTPGADYNGPVNLTIGLTEALLNIPITTVLPLSIAPVADIVPDSVSTTPGTSVSFNVLANDTFENPGRVVSSYTTPSHGSVTIDAQGNAVYNPTAGYTGTDTFNYTVTSNGTTETAPVTVTIAPINHPPTATPIADVAANDAQTVNINVSGAFSDVDGDTLSYSATGLPSGLSINASTGVVSGTLGGHASTAVAGGIYTVVVTANDGHGGTVSQSFHLDVSNPPPIAVNDSGSGVANSVITGNVLTNDSDPDGDALTVSTLPVVAPAHGLLVLSANGNYSYTPALNFTGSDSFTYRVTDADGGTATAVVSLVISAVNHAPVAVADVASVNANSSVVVNVLANDFDVDGDAITVTGASAAHGTVAINANGTLAYTPNLNYYGTDTITYTIQDSHGLAAVLPGTVTVAVNANPLIQLPSVSVSNEDTPIVFASALGTQISVGNLVGDVASVTLSAPLGTFTLAQTTGLSFSHGTGTNDTSVTFQGSTANINAALNGLVYTPGADYNGPVALSLGVTDTLLGIPITATLPLTIAPVADIVPDSVSTTTGTSVSFNVLANDTFENPGRVVSSYTSPLHGNVTIDAQGNASYIPTAGYNGIDTFNYTVTSNGTTETAAVTVTISPPVNHAPTALPIADVAANDAQTVNINVSGAFSDVDGDTLSYAAAGLPAGLSINTGTGVISGTLGGHASTAVTGGVYTVVVTASDGHGGSVNQSFHLDVSNPPPIANNDYAVGFSTSVVYGNVLTNDSDPDGDALTVSTTPVVAPTHGTVVLSANGNYAYTPTLNFTGNDSFTYRVTDADGGTATAVVNILVTAPINNLPIAAADTAFVNAGSSTTINVLANDSDPNGYSLSVTHVSALHGTVTTNPDGTLTYTPTVGFYGADVITYGLQDSQGNTALVDGTVAVTVNALPTLQLPTLPVLYEDTPVVFASVLGTQISVGDVDGNVAQVSLSVPLGKLTLSQTTGLSFSQGTGTSDTNVTFEGTIAAVNAALNGLVYTPGADYNGPVTLTIGLTDTLIGVPITTQLPLNITPVADIVPDSVTTVSGHSVGFNVLANDTFENPGRVVSSYTTPAHGSVTIDAQGNAIYNPTAGFSGTDTFDYTVTSNGTTETTTVTVTVNHTPPTATAISDVAANDAQTISVATAPSFHDADGDTLSYSATGLPSGLSINASTGVISGTLGGHDSVAVSGGVYTVVVTANDGQGGTVDQSFHITVSNPPPTAVNESATLAENTSASGNVMSADSDPDGDSISVTTTPVQAPAHGTLVLNADGSYVYTPTANYVGSDSFTYQLVDADGGTATAVVSLTITAVNHAPTSTTPADRSNAVGTAVTVDESAYYADPDGDTLTYTATGLPPGLSVNAGTGVISGTLSTVGSYSVTLTATDPGGLATSQTFHWNTTAAPDNAPNTVGSLPAGAGNDGTAVSISTAAGFSDPDGDTLTYSASGLPAGLSINASTGVISGTLDGHASSVVNGGAYTIVVTADDGRGGTAMQGFTFTASNVPPVANNDTGTGPEGGTITGNVLSNDSDPDGDPLAVTTTPVSAPAHGSLVLHADGSYVYTPNANYSGSDSFTYQVTDGDGGSATAVVSLTVTAVDHAPTSTAIADRNNTVGTSVNVSEAANFSDVDGDALSYAATGLPPGLTVDPNTGIISGTLGAAGTYTVTLTATDPSGLATSQTFQWVSAAAHSGPNTVGTLSTDTANDSSAVSIATAGGFSDASGDTLTYSVAGLPAGLSINASTGVISGTLDGHASTAVSGGVYTIVVTADDGHGGTAAQGFTFTAVNPPPMASNATATGAEDSTISGNVLTNVTDPDGDALTVNTTPVSAPAHGSLVLHADGSYVYTPNTGYAGSDSFTYQVTDADGGSATATVTFNITAVYHAPTSTAIADRSDTVGATVSVTEASNFSDVDGNTLTYTATGLPPGLAIDPNTGIVSGTLQTAGAYNVTLTATDPSGLSTSQTFHWVSAAAHSGPNTVGTLSTDSGNDGSAVSIATAGNFSDASGDTLTYSATGLPAGLSINASTGVISGTLDGHASTAVSGGVYTIVVTADDGHGGTAAQGFTFTAVNPPPVAGNATATGAEGGTISGNVLANVTDPDGDALTVNPTPVSAPAHGSLVLHADGSYVYTPNAGYAGSDSFTYQVTDADGGSTTAVVSFTVTAVYHAPTSTPIADRSDAVGATVSVNEASNFSDVDGNTLVYTATGLPPGLAIDANTGVISGTLQTAGAYAITLTATDPSGLATSQSFHWTTTAAVGTGPSTVGTLPTGSADDSGAVTIATAGGFSDASGDTLTYSATGLPAGLSINAGTGVISGTLGSHASTAIAGGVYTIVVTADDGHGGTAAQGFTFTAVNPPPVATNATATGNEGGTISGNVLANVSDPDGDALTVTTTPVQAPAHGSLVLNADGSYVYTPNTGYAGSDSFSYQVTDADGGSTTATVNFTVTVVHHAPTSTALADQNNAVGDAVSIGEASHFSDADGNTLTYTATGLPPGLAIDANTGLISGTLQTAGNYAVTLTATDPNGLATSQTFHWTTTAAASPGPNTVGTLATGTAGDSGVVTIATAGGFSDAHGDTLTYSATGLPAGLSINASTGVISGTLDGHASTAVSGGVYTIVVTADDGHGGTATQGFTFTAVNPPPVAGNATATGAEGGTISGNVLANVTDPDGDALTVNPTPVSAPAHGSLVLHADGSYVYTPNAGYAGSDSFTYQVTDADGGSTTATVSFNVTVVHHAPSSTAIADQNNPVGTAVSIVEASHFSDADGNALIYTATGLPPGLSIDPNTGVVSGTLQVVGNYAVTLTATDPGGLTSSQTFHWTTTGGPDNAPNTVGTLAGSGGNDGAAVSIATAGAFSDPDGDPLTYSAAGLPAGLSINASTGVISGTLDGHASTAVAGGVYTIVVTADDGRGGSSSQGFTFTAANLPPLASNATAAGTEDGTISGNVLANVNDPDGDALTVNTTPVAAPAHGSLVLNADGSYVYTPNANYNGSDSFTYQVTDADGGSATATVTFNIAAVNHAPTSTALPDRSNTVGTAVTVSEASHYSDVDGNALVYSATGLPPGLTLDATTGVISGTLGVTGTYSVTLTATDPSGLATSETFHWTTAAAANNSPNTVGMLATGSANDSGSVNIATAGGFSDPDGNTLSYSATGLPAGLSINTGTGVISGTLSGHASTAVDGGVYTIVVTADDGHGGTATQGFTFTASNPAPVAGNGTASGTEGHAISGNVLANVTDPDGDALTVSTTPLAAPAHGSLVLNADGSYVYTPDTHYAGSDSFTYRVTDADGGTATATVTLSVAAGTIAPASTPVGDHSNAVGDRVTIDETGHFSPVDGQPLSYSATGLPPGLSVDPHTGIISGTLTAAGSYTVTLTATDVDGLSTSQSFGWATTEAANHGPSAVGALATANNNDGGQVLIATAPGFHDADGDPLTYSASGLPPGLAIDPVTGVISGTLAAHTSSAAPGGVYTVVVSAADGHGGSASQGFTITVTNPGPMVSGIETASGSTGSTISGNVLSEVTDADGDPLTVDTAPVVAPQHGTLTVHADGSYVYTPNANYSGSDSFTTRITDADGKQVLAQVVVTVTPVTPVVVVTPPTDPTAPTPSDGTATAATGTGTGTGTIVATGGDPVTSTPTTPATPVTVVTATPQTVALNPDNGTSFNNLTADGDQDNAPLLTLTQTQLEQNATNTETVLLAAVNGVKRLEGMGDLSAARPLLAAVGALHTLGGHVELLAGETPMGQVVGDMNSGFKAPLQIDDFINGPSGTQGATRGPAAAQVGARDSGLSPEALLNTTPFQPGDAPPLASLAPAVFGEPHPSAALSGFSLAAEQPTTLTAQLRIASLQSSAELEALADALN